MSFLRRPAAHRGTRDEVPPLEVQAVLDTGALLLDVREEHEWDAGHAPSALHVPLATLPAHVDRLPADRTIIVVCRSGRRSAHAVTLLAHAGLDARNVTGGMTAWQRNGLPVITDGGAPGRVA